MKVANVLIDAYNNSNQDKIIQSSFLDYALYLSKREAIVLSIFNDQNTLSSSENKIWSVLQKKITNLNAHFEFWWRLVNFEPDVAICHSAASLKFLIIVRLFTMRRFPIISICDEEPIKHIKADFLITRYSEIVKNLLNLKIAREKIMVINHAIEVKNDFVAKVKNITKSPITLCSVGLLDKNMNFDLVLKALAQLNAPDIKFKYVIYGSGEEEANLINIAQDLGVNDHFKIINTVEDIEKFYEAVDICIIPSQEMAANKYILEPMLYGVPLIVSATSNNNEIIDDGVNGFRISIDNPAEIPNEIIQKINFIVNNQFEVSQITKRGYFKIIDRYSSEVIASRLYQLCQNLTN